MSDKWVTTTPFLTWASLFAVFCVKNLTETKLMHGKSGSQPTRPDGTPGRVERSESGRSKRSSERSYQPHFCDLV